MVETSGHLQMETECRLQELNLLNIYSTVTSDKDNCVFVGNWNTDSIQEFGRSISLTRWRKENLLLVPFFMKFLGRSHLESREWRCDWGFLFSLLTFVFLFGCWGRPCFLRLASSRVEISPSVDRDIWFFSFNIQ